MDLDPDNMIVKSRPLRKCGLKLIDSFFIAVSDLVTSLAEVWIEIGKSYVDTAFVIPSLPLRKCGLKYSCPLPPVSCLWSLPLRKCGLKLRNTKSPAILVESLPLRKCGLKLSQLGELLSPPWSLPLRKCGLKCQTHHCTLCPI